METLQFKTTIKCSGCIEKVTPYLNETVGENNWEVDLQNPQKVLTIPNAEQLQSGEVVEALAKAGYKAEKI
jgi:copper chaperone CopZ